MSNKIINSEKVWKKGKNTHNYFALSTYELKKSYKCQIFVGQGEFNIHCCAISTHIVACFFFTKNTEQNITHNWQTQKSSIVPVWGRLSAGICCASTPRTSPTSILFVFFGDNSMWFVVTVSEMLTFANSCCFVGLSLYFMRFVCGGLRYCCKILCLLRQRHLLKFSKANRTNQYVTCNWK